VRENAEVDHVADHRGDRRGLPSSRRIVGARHGAGADQDLRELLLRQVLGRVPVDHVSDFVSEDARELGFAPEASEEPRRQEDLAAR
jgi:hypothetical protein